jgi:predicted phosphoribosyltransferase
MMKRADQVVCLKSVGQLGSVGAYYDDFTQVEEKAVIELLGKCRHPSPA